MFGSPANSCRFSVSASPISASKYMRFALPSVTTAIPSVIFDDRTSAFIGRSVWFVVYFLPAAASSITFATSLGCDNITTWLDGRVVVVALICLAILFSCSGAIMLSSLATMYHDGLLCHAATVGFAPKMDPDV